MAEITSKRFMAPLQRSDFTFRLSAPGSYKLFYDSIKIMHDFTDKVIEDRRTALQKSIADGTYKPMGMSKNFFY